MTTTNSTPAYLKIPISGVVMGGGKIGIVSPPEPFY